MTSPELLTAAESCSRRGFYAARWHKHRLTSSEMTRLAVTSALRSDVPDIGEAAGSNVMTLARDRGLDLDGSNVYRVAVNHSAIADIVATAIRKPGEPAWLKPPAVPDWISSASIDSTGSYLRRFLPVSTWNEDRQRHEIRSWFTLGETATYGLPMQLIVAILGPTAGGRRTGYFSKALLHPSRSSLRFRLRSRKTVEGFKESFTSIYREEHDQISREQWLDAMHADGVLADSLFVVHVPVPGELEIQAIRDLAKRRLDALPLELPDRQLSTCDGPLAACPFRVCCWSQPESRPDDGGFDEV